MSKSESPLGDEIVRIKLSDIHVPQHQSSDHKGLKKIKDSLKAVGIVQPLIVQKIDGVVTLVVGLRRYAAAKELGWKEVPAVFLDSNDALVACLVRVAKNIRKRQPYLARCEDIEAVRQTLLKRGVQKAPRGGKQPHDTCVKKTSRLLGIPKKEVQQARDVAALSDTMKDLLRREGQDDLKGLILDLAKGPMRGYREVLSARAAILKTRMRPPRATAARSGKPAPVPSPPLIPFLADDRGLEGDKSADGANHGDGETTKSDCSAGDSHRFPQHEEKLADLPELDDAGRTKLAQLKAILASSPSLVLRHFVHELHKDGTEVDAMIDRIKSWTTPVVA